MLVYAPSLPPSSLRIFAQEFRFNPRRFYPDRLASSSESVRGARGRQRNSWFCFGECASSGTLRGGLVRGRCVRAAQ